MRDLHSERRDRHRRATAAASAVRAGSVVLAGLLLALALGGCGGGNSGASSGTPGLSLNQRVLRSTALPRLHAIALVRPVTSAQAWLANAGVVGEDLTRQSSELDRLGFVAGARETLVSQRRSIARVISSVEQFRSAAGARSALHDQYARAHAAAGTESEGFNPFRVPQIPGAMGYEISGPGVVAQTVAFASGPFYYLITATAPPGEPGAPNREQLLSAAAALYRRVHGQSCARARSPRCATIERG
jgi:hypothetical protein